MLLLIHFELFAGKCCALGQIILRDCRKAIKSVRVIWLFFSIFSLNVVDYGIFFNLLIQGLKSEFCQIPSAAQD